MGRREAFIGRYLTDAEPFFDRWGVMDHALALRPPTGLIMEFGVFYGMSLRYLAQRVQHTVYGFDSFEGLPEAWDAGSPAGTFRVPVEDRVAVLQSSGENVRFVAGLFQQTLPVFLTEHPGPVSFLHVDSDIYSSAKFVLDSLESRLVKGSVVLFDELYNYDAWEDHEWKAWNEFLERTHQSFQYVAYNSNGEQVAVQFQ